MPGQKPDIANDPQKAVEFDRLKNLLNASQNLPTLEANYQNIKGNPLYKGKKYKDNKKMLDHLYQEKKHFFQFSNNSQLLSNNKPKPSSS